MNGRNGRHPLPDPLLLPTGWARRACGLATQVVAYDDAGGAFASRLWWLLRWLGHDRVAVLDGGIDRWLAEGRPLATEVCRRSIAGGAGGRSAGRVVSSDAVAANLD
jgi:thiosulfate/3-mercaptopyruvate sulfurtransferase